MIEIKKIEYINHNFKLKIENIKIEKGRIFIICGPNGTGKSTLIKILSLLLKPNTADFKIFNKKCFENKKTDFYIRRKMSILLQNPYLFNTSVYKNLNIVKKLKQSNKNIDKILEEFNLVHLKTKNINKLSGGERQIVAIARTFISDDDIYIYDEPTIFLDNKNKNLLNKKILELKEQNKPIIIATHDFHFAGQISDNIDLELF